MLKGETIIEWHVSEEFPLGVPLILCVHELDNINKCYVEGPRTIIRSPSGYFEILDGNKKSLSGVRIYAWAPWPEPIERKVRERI